MILFFRAGTGAMRLSSAVSQQAEKEALVAALANPAQPTSRKRPPNMVDPQVVLDHANRSGKESKKKGASCAVLAKKHRVGLKSGAKTSFLEAVGACQWNKYGESAGQDTDGVYEANVEKDPPRSVPINIMQTVIEMLPTVSDGAAYWRGVICGVQDQGDGKIVIVIDFHPFHLDSSFKTSCIDAAVHQQGMKLVPDLILTEEWKVASKADPKVVIDSKEAMCQTTYPAVEFKLVDDI